MNILPFRGIFYNTDKLDLRQVVTLPYDKINAQLKEEYSARSPFNAVNLILPETNQDSARLWQEWLEKGILQQDEKPFFYIYQQEYEYPAGIINVRTGLVALLEVQPFSKQTVMPHEKTFSRIRAAREKLLDVCQANFGHIFMLYSDQENKVDSVLASVLGGAPRLGYKDESEVIHRLWTISKPELIKELKRLFKDKPLFIADGHHRYGAALDYREKQKAARGEDYSGQEGFNYRMVTLVNVDARGVRVLPTHRVVKSLPDLNREQLLNELEKYFFVSRDTIPAKEMLPEWLAGITRLSAEHAFGMYLGGVEFYTLRLKPKESLEDILGLARPRAWLYLDVNILHLLILKNILGIDTHNAKDEANLMYLRDPYEVIDWVKESDCGIAFILNPTKITEVKEIVRLGEVMPHKSTDFYPKLNTGMVMRKLEDIEKCNLVGQ